MKGDKGSGPNAAPRTVSTKGDVVGLGPQLKLIVGEEVRTFPLPQEGSVFVGRSSDCDVRIDHPSISRKHACIELGASRRITDLGSANGTFVAGHRLAAHTPVMIGPSDVIELGSVMLVVQTSGFVGALRRIWHHGDFEARLDEECGRGTPFALLRVKLSAGSEPDLVEPALLGIVRAGDSVARYTSDEYHVLLPGVTVAKARDMTATLLALMRMSAITATAAAACYPQDGRTAGELIASAAAQLAPPTDPVIVVPPPQSAMTHVYKLLARVAAGPFNILLVGETGVGKEVAAEAVHRLSQRQDKPLVRINCAALPSDLLERELFGYEKGAFTGATERKRGLLESSHEGTVYLDEIGELPMATQVKLLRVIESRQLTRLGGVSPRKVDLRFVAATSRDLELQLARGTFRQDLYSQLCGIAVVVPPLRERVDEIEPLARAFIAAAAKAAGKPVPQLSTAALAAIREYTWPGNIRELRNAIERAVLLSDRAIDTASLSMEKLRSTLRAPVQSRGGTLATGPLANAPRPNKAGTPSSRPEPNAAPRRKKQRNA